MNVGNGTVKILWPDGPRWVTAQQVINWAQDSYENNADWRRCSICGLNMAAESPSCDHECYGEPVYDEPAERPLRLGAAVAWLSDTGEVTFAKNRGGEP